MDRIWLAAPNPALKVWEATTGTAWRLNAAAAALGQRRGLAESAWQRIATDLFAVHERCDWAACTGCLSADGLGWESTPLAPGALVWMRPLETALDVDLERAAGEVDPHVSRAPEIGVFGHDPERGAGYADATLARLFEVDARIDRSGMAGWLKRICTIDRARLLAKRRLALRSGGCHELIFQLVTQPARPVRRLHALFEVRAGRLIGVIVEANGECDFERRHQELNRALQVARLIDWRGDSATRRLHPDTGGAVPASEASPRVSGAEAAASTAFGAGAHGSAIAAPADSSIDRDISRFDTLAKLAGLGVWTAPDGGDRMRWNGEMHRITGLATQAPRIPDVRDWLVRWVHPEDCRSVSEAYARARAGAEQAVELTYRIVRADGAVRWLVSRTRRVERKWGRGLTGVVFDASELVEQRRRAGEVQVMQESARRDSLARFAFLGRVSHELRTPLNAVIGFAQLIEQDGPHSNRALQVDRARRVRQAGEHLLTLVDDLLGSSNGARPAAPNDASPRPDPLPAPPVEATASDGLSLLYIEDNPVNAMLVAELLAMRTRARLRIAVDGAAGVAAASAEPPDVALIDLQLPDFDGFEVLRRLRADPALDGCVMVALSANSLPEDLARGRAAGFDDYWTKPIDFEAFLKALNRLGAAKAGAVRCSARREPAK